LAGVAHRQRGEDHFAHVGRIGRRCPFPVGKEPALPALAFLLNNLNGTLPTFDLRRVEFAQGEHPTLHHPLRAQAHALAQRVVDVRLAVLATNVAFQEHALTLPNRVLLG
jgi:hypothetical protein